MPTDPRPLLRPLWLLCCTLALAATCSAQAVRQQSAPEQAATLERLREDYAMRYLEPEPHMALAKYFRDAGNRLQAFYILETARRGRFEEAEFDAAFKTYFLGQKPFDNSPEAEARLLAELARQPDSPDTLFGLADIYISREDYAKAKPYLKRLIAREPDDLDHVTALAQVYEREGDEAASERVVREWVRAHPDAAESYRVRASEIAETAPARAKALLAEGAAKFPKDAYFPFYLAGIHLRENNLKEAERLYVRAAELAPDSSEVQAWVGRFFFKAAPDDRRALDYYLNAYLLDPHAYETEYVESRIPKLNERLAAARFKELTRRGVPPAKAAEDPDPFVVMAAVEEMGKGWKPAYLETVVGLMAHDDGGVRWQATELLKAKADASFDPRLRELLQDRDLRRRGLAAYVAVHRWKGASFDLMRRMLGEPVQLLRFDAISALILEGGPEGLEVALEHAAREPHPKLKKLIESAKGQRQPR